MRRLAVVLVTVVLALLPFAPARADGFCSVSEGCSPCPPPTVTVDKQHGVQIVWVYC